MNTERLQEIKQKLDSSGTITAEEALYLFGLIEKFEKKTDLLSQQLLELTQEIENVRGDFNRGR